MGAELFGGKYFCHSSHENTKINFSFKQKGKEQVYYIKRLPSRVTGIQFLTSNILKGFFKFSKILIKLSDQLFEQEVLSSSNVKSYSLIDLQQRSTIDVFISCENKA